MPPIYYSYLPNNGLFQQVMNGSYTSPKQVNLANYFTSYSKDEIKLLDDINNLRKKEDMAPLNLSNELSKGADIYSNEMGTNLEFKHPAQRYGDAALNMIADLGGYKGNITSEILAFGYKNAQGTFSELNKRDEHKSVILNKYATDIGISKIGEKWIVAIGKED